MALFGRARRMPPPSPYPTRNPAQILAMNEAAQASERGASTMVIEGQPAEARAMPPAPQGASFDEAFAPMAQQSAPMPRTPPTMRQGPLGASMRQGFDYQAAYEALAGDQRKAKPWQHLLAGVGDALVDWSGGRGTASQRLHQFDQAQQDRMFKAAQLLAHGQHRDFVRQNEADLRASAPYTIGRNRLQFDPATGQTDVLYAGAEDFQIYADELGLQQGTPEYENALQDYVLRASGPTAHARDMELDDHRTENDRGLENLRFGNRQAMERQRQGNRREMERARQGNRIQLRQTPPAGRVSRGSKPKTDIVTVKTPAEARRLAPGTRFRTPDGRVKVAK